MYLLYMKISCQNSYNRLFTHFQTTKFSSNSGNQYGIQDYIYIISEYILLNSNNKLVLSKYVHFRTVSVRFSIG